jgi:hypothetical protein
MKIMTYTRITAARAFLNEIAELIDQDSKIVSQTDYDLVYNYKVAAGKITKIKKQYDAVVEVIKN